MLEFIKEILTNLWHLIIPFTVIEQYDGGVMLRLGKFHRELKPGFHWKWPFLETVLSHSCVITTMSLHPQTLTTKDQKSVVVKGIVKYRISDVKTFLLEVNDAVDAISDITQGFILEVIEDKTWDECMTNNIDSIISRKVRNEAKKWGIEVVNVTLTNKGLIRTLRLMQDQQNQNAPTT